MYPRRSKASHEPYAAEGSNAAQPAQKLRSKLTTLVDRQEKLKIAYNQLQSQIAFGLAEAGDVFESLAIPLMKLVGMKTSEMESEGRQSTLIFNTERYRMNTAAHTGTRYDDLNSQIRSSKEENYAAKAELAGQEIVHRHKGQFRQLVHMLKDIETQVNSHHEDILKMIDQRRTFFQDFIQKAYYGLRSVHSKDHDTFPVTVKLLKFLFNNINEVLESVDNGVNDLILALAKNMCNPMTKYVSSLATEIKVGPCVQLMDVVNEMEKKNADTKRELQYAKEMIRLEKEAKIDALSRLKKAEDQVQRLAKFSRFLPPAGQQKQTEHSITRKRLGIEGSRETEEKLLWDLLSKKRKLQVPESPMGPNELIRQAETKQNPLVCNRRMTRSQARLGSKMTLGMSPSARTVNWR